jgi:DNA-directed RNA polymerase specialized sigma24 family protein
MRIELVTDPHAPPPSSSAVPDPFGEPESAPDWELERPRRPGVTPEYEAMVADARVTAHIKKLLCTWIEPEHHDDLLQQVRVRLLVCADPPPTTDRLLRLATTVTRGRVIDMYRRDDVRQGEISYEEQGLDDDGDDGHQAAQQERIARAAKDGHLTDASDELYVRERIQFVEAQIAEGTVSREDVEIAARTGTGETTYEEEARERGTTEGSLRVRVHRVRMLLRTRFAKFSAGSLGVLLLLWLLMMLLAALFGGVTKSTPSSPEPGSAPIVVPSPSQR